MVTANLSGGEIQLKTTTRGNSSKAIDQDLGPFTMQTIPATWECSK